MNKKIVFLTFCSVACLFSCTNKKDVNEDIKNIYKDISNGNKLKAFIIKDNNYYIFENSTDIISLGRFDESTYSFDNSNDFGFILPSSGVINYDDLSISNISKLIVNYKSKEIYSFIDYNTKALSKIYNSNNFDNLYFYNDFNNEKFSNGYEVNLKIDNYNKISCEDIREYYLNSFNKYNDLKEIDSLYKNISISDEFNGKKVVSIGNLSNTLKSLKIDNINFTFSNNIENVSEDAFNGLKFNNDLNLSNNLINIEDNAFKNSQINKLLVHDKKINYKDSSFLNLKLNEINFDHEDSNNLNLIDDFISNNYDLKVTINNLYYDKFTKIKEIYKKATNNEINTKAYLVKNNHYYVFDGIDKITQLGIFDLDKNEFSNSNEFGFILPSSGTINYDSSNVLECSKLLVNLNNKNIYSYINLDGEISNDYNGNNFDNLYFYGDSSNNDISNGYEVSLKIDNYLKISNEEVRNYYLNNFLSYNDLKDQKDIKKLYDKIILKNDFNNKNVVAIGNFSKVLKDIELTSINLNLSENIEYIKEDAFNGISFNNEVLTLNKKLKNIDIRAFAYSNINTLYVYDNEIEFYYETYNKFTHKFRPFEDDSFYEANVKNIHFETYNSGNSLLSNYLAGNNSELIIKCGKNLNSKYYDSISEGLNIEKTINPLCDLKDISNNVIEDNNLTLVDTNESLILSIKNKLDDGNLYNGSNVREYGTLDAKTANSIPNMLSSDFVNKYTKNVYTLKLKNDLTIKGKVYVGATINSEAQRNQGYITGDYVTLDLNGHNVYIEDGGVLESSGYIIDSSANQSGMIEIKNGGTLSTNFNVEDYSGGQITKNRYDKNVSPFNLFKLGYLQVNTKINKGGKLNGLCVLYASYSQNEAIQTIIGEDGLFDISSNDGYIIKRAKFINNEYDGIDHYEIYGDCKTNSMTLRVGAIALSTSKLFLPLTRFQTIDIYKGKFTMNTKLKVLPGTEVNVYNGATLVINENVIIYEEYKTQAEVGVNYFANYCDYYASSKYDKDNINQGQINFYNGSNLIVNDGNGINGLINVEDNNVLEVIKNMYENTNFNNKLESIESDGTTTYYIAASSNITKYYKDLKDKISLISTIKEENHKVITA